MGKGTASLNGSADGIADSTAAVAVTDTETGHTDSAAAAATEAGNTTGSTTEKAKRPRKPREIPVVVTPDAPAIPQPSAAEKTPKKAKPAKADPTIVAALVAVAGTTMTITGKMLHDEKTWTPVGNELVAVAEPAARIIERFAATETVSKYADYVALGMAVAGIIIPRVLLTMNKPTGVKNDGKKNRSRVAANTEAGTHVAAAATAGEKAPQVNAAHAASDGLKSALALGD